MVRYKVEVVVIQKRTTYLIIPIHQKKKKKETLGRRYFVKIQGCRPKRGDRS